MAALFVLLGIAGILAALAPGPVWVKVAAGAGAPAWLLLGGAYGRWGPSVLGKRRDGGHQPALYLLFWPYHLVNAVNLHLVALLGREHAVDEVLPGIWVGRRMTRLDGEWIRPGRFAAVVDATAEFPELAPLRHPAYHCVPLLDLTAPTPEQMRAAVAFIHLHLPSGDVFIHCAAGHGRSATLAAAWLLSTGGASDAEAAEARLRLARPGIHLNSEQRRALQTYVSERE